MNTICASTVNFRLENLPLELASCVDVINMTPIMLGWCQLEQVKTNKKDLAKVNGGKQNAVWD